MKRWKKMQVMYDAQSGARTEVYLLQIKVGTDWVTVGMVNETTDGRYMAASAFGSRLHYPSGNSAKAHRGLAAAKREALDIIEANAQWSVPW